MKLSSIAIIFVLICSVALTSALATSTVAPLIIQAKGTTQEVGKQVGAAAKEKIMIRWNRADIQQYLIPFAQGTSEGKALMAQLLNASMAFNPRLIDEYHGMAEGLGLTFDDVFLLNTLYEVSTYMQRINVPTGREDIHVSHCSDIMAHSALDGSAVWGHNEDGGLFDRASVYYVNATVTDTIHGEVTMMCLTYPGSVCANAFGWNSHGLVTSFNAIFPDNLDFLRPPVNIVTRQLIESRTMDELHMTLYTTASSSGKNANTFSTKVNQQTEPFLSVEASPFGDVAAHRTRSPFATTLGQRQALASGVATPNRYYYHTNIYLKLNAPCFQGPSSLHRLRVFNNDYSPPNTTVDIRRMLGDTTDPNYPVYRNGTKLDHAQTLSTAVFDFASKSVQVWWDANPKLTSPTWTWKLW